MAEISVIICTHNPRPDYLHRVLRALDGQTLPKDRWELLVVDNASDRQLAGACDLSWHARARHVRHSPVGLMLARLRGIAESCGELLVFVDDDNVLAPGYLEEALALQARYPFLGVFGSGSLEPEFEVQPPKIIRPYLKMLCLRSVSSTLWSNNPEDHHAIPWGAGLCVSRPVADLYLNLVEKLGIGALLARNGRRRLFAGDDDLFSWAAASAHRGFGIFPHLQITHLIPVTRLDQGYVLTLLHDHAFSHSILRYRMKGTLPRRIEWSRYVHLLMHGVKNGPFSMRCQWAVSRGEDHAARFIREERLQPIAGTGDLVAVAQSRSVEEEPG